MSELTPVPVSEVYLELSFCTFMSWLGSEFSVHLDLPCMCSMQAVTTGHLEPSLCLSHPVHRGGVPPTPGEAKQKGRWDVS